MSGRIAVEVVKTVTTMSVAAGGVTVAQTTTAWSVVVTAGTAVASAPLLPVILGTVGVATLAGAGVYLACKRPGRLHIWRRKKDEEVGMAYEPVTATTPPDDRMGPLEPAPVPPSSPINQNQIDQSQGQDQQKAA